jgi:hypothetical protein
VALAGTLERSNEQAAFQLADLHCGARPVIQISLRSPDKGIRGCSESAGYEPRGCWGRRRCWGRRGCWRRHGCWGRGRCRGGRKCWGRRRCRRGCGCRGRRGCWGRCRGGRGGRAQRGRRDRCRRRARRRVRRYRRCRRGCKTGAVVAAVPFSVFVTASGVGDPGRLGRGKWVRLFFWCWDGSGAAEGVTVWVESERASACV